MQTELDRLMGWISESRAEICFVTHRADRSQFTSLPDGRSVTFGDGGSAVLDTAALTPEGMTLTVCGVKLEPGWFAGLPVGLAGCGVRRIELDSWGWWIEAGTAPKVAQVVDHVACHLPSPLTGSGRARSGYAFVDMRDAYDRGRDAAEHPDVGGEGTTEVVLWHTAEEGAPSDEEMIAARSAGCSVASPSVAPWAVGARAAGMEFGAIVTALIKVERER